jgi:hypothetical protein
VTGVILTGLLIYYFYKKREKQQQKVILTKKLSILNNNLKDEVIELNKNDNNFNKQKSELIKSGKNPTFNSSDQKPVFISEQKIEVEEINHIEQLAITTPPRSPIPQRITTINVKQLHLNELKEKLIGNESL